VGDVAVLFTQFSFANWIGNHADQIHAVRTKLDELAYRVRLFKPEFTVPFASFIYFCNAENSWMNDFMITPEHIAALELPGVNFMYPGDRWDSSQEGFHSEKAIQAYMRDIGNLTIDPTPPSVEPEKVREAIVKLLSMLRKRFGKTIAGRIRPFSIYAHDIDCVFLASPRDASCEIVRGDARAAETARYAICSQAAWYAFNFTWGWGTLEVSGMYLDRQFESHGANRFLNFWVNALSTDFLNFSSPARARRTVQFLWDKKFELLYRFVTSRASENHTSVPARAGMAHPAASSSLENAPVGARSQKINAE